MVKAKNWRVRDIEKALGRGITPQMAQLVKVASAIIITAWREKSNSEHEFSALYEEHHGKAAGALAAMVELLEAVGEGKAMPDEYATILSQRSIT